VCGACPGGTPVSPTTATLNQLGRKRLLLTQLRRGLAPGCTLTLQGDGWALRRRTGRQEVFADVEHLIASLEASQGEDWASGYSPWAVVRIVLENATSQVARVGMGEYGSLIQDRSDGVDSSDRRTT
jgi:hypothetical protein